jgi:hypothetical protein
MRKKMTQDIYYKYEFLYNLNVGVKVYEFDGNYGYMELGIPLD